MISLSCRNKLGKGSDKREENGKVPSFLPLPGLPPPLPFYRCKAFMYCRHKRCIAIIAEFLMYAVLSVLAYDSSVDGSVRDVPQSNT